MTDQVKSITKKSVDISGWYNDVIERAKLAEHGPVRGTMIIRPYGFALWEAIQKALDIKIKDLGAENAYFPLFIPQSFLEKEKEHVEGFAPEFAVVTHGGGEKLPEPLVVRPTSETIIHDAFSRWVQSYRDLPLVINQWANVVRWEKRPYLFIRTTEFLWQEGHSAHENMDKAKKMVQDALKMYVDFYQSTLGLYGYAGRKSEKEKFAGAVASYSYEILMPDGKIIQGCTSHELGQNFSKVFNIEFQNQERQKEYAWMTSWGLSTRSMGPLIAVHGDDKGLVLPPVLAPVQVIIIPIVTKTSDLDALNKLSQKAFEILESHNIRVKIDKSDQSPGWKFNQHDLEGVPIRIEIGPNEIRGQQLSLATRDKNQRLAVPLAELPTEINKLLAQVQANLLDESKKLTHANTRQADTYDQFKEIMSTTRGFIEAFWCEDPKCEAKIKEETKATTRCLPFEAIESKGGCIYCGKPAKFRWLFGQSY